MRQAAASSGSRTSRVLASPKLLWLGAVLAGAMLPLSMAPFGIWWLGPISLGIWFALLMREATDGSGRGFMPGWLYGCGLYGLGVSWIYVSIHEHGGAPPLLAGLLVSLFVAAMALFPMLNATLLVRLVRVEATRQQNDRQGSSPDPWITGAILFVVLLIGFEWLLGWFLTGFPWLAAGYGQLDTPLAGLAPVGGVSMVSALTALVGVSAALIVRELFSGAGSGKKRRPLLIAAGVLVVLPWPVGALLTDVSWTDPGDEQTAALVQGNVAQTTKWLPENRLPIVQRYRRLTEPHWGADLILWPEAAITVFEHQAEDLLAQLDAEALEHGSGLILGLPAVETGAEGEYSFLNTARGLGLADGRYIKRRLVPFGEYVPLEGVLRGMIQFFDLPMSHARAGDWRQTGLAIDGHPAGMAICYEVVYPELVRDAATVLLTISNDTWFGASIGPHQHLAIARMRALENGRWLLRATNNGISAIVDPRGQVREQFPQFEPGVLTGGFRIMTGQTPFNRLGPWPLYGFLLLLGGFAIFRKAGN